MNHVHFSEDKVHVEGCPESSEEMRALRHQVVCLNHVRTGNLEAVRLLLRVKPFPLDKWSSGYVDHSWSRVRLSTFRLAEAKVQIRSLLGGMPFCDCPYASNVGRVGCLCEYALEYHVIE